MTINDILAALASHNYLGLFLLLTLYARKLTSADSKFPLSISPTWRPIVSAAAGLVYGVLASVQAGMSWGNAALGGAVAAGASGFLDGVLMAIFSHDNAPAWAKAIVFLFDDITGAGGGEVPPVAPPNAKPPAFRFGSKSPPPSKTLTELPKLPKAFIPEEPETLPPPALKRCGLAGVFAWCVTFVAAAVGGTTLAVATSCTPAQQAVFSTVEQKVLDDVVAGKTLTQIETDVATLLVGTPGTDVVLIVNEALTLLVDIGAIPPSYLPQAKVLLAESSLKAAAHRQVTK